MMPLFTVIINNYNYARFLKTAIESIRAQTFPDYELIVVDDGSNDGSQDVARRYQSVHLIETARLGQAGACLRAIQKARGEYIYLLDADDAANPDLLATVAPLTAQTPSKIQFQLEAIDGDGRPIGASFFPIYPPDYSNNDIVSSICHTGFYITPQTSGNVFARSIFNGLDPIDYETAIDGITLLIAPFRGPVLSLNCPLAKYRLHGTNESRRMTSDRFHNEKDRFANRLRHLSRLLAESGEQIALSRPPEEMFFYIDKTVMQTFSETMRFDYPLLLRFLTALYREANLGRSLKLTAWLLLSSFGPRHLQLLLMESHANPWSPLRRRGRFLAALIGLT